MFLKITPVPKPRMTMRDKWAKRPSVVRYFGFCDSLRALGESISGGDVSLTFGMPIPKSVSKKKREQLKGNPHLSRPDIDNLIKAVLDALLEEDSHVWKLSASKIWSEDGFIIINEPTALERA